MKKLTFIGLGIAPDRDLSLGALESIRKSDVILYHGFPGAKALFKSWGAKKIEDIGPLYRDGDEDLANYRRIQSRISATLKEHKQVGFATHGHPWFGVTLTEFLLRECEQLKVKFEVIPGVSSFDTMIRDLKIDPLERGCQILDVNRVLLFNHPLNPHLDAFLYHICSVGTALTNFKDPSIDNHLDMLTKWLLKFYPPQQEAQIIHSSSKSSKQPVIFRFPVKDLNKQMKVITFGTTLFIKGSKPTTYNKKFLSLLRDSAT